MLVAATTLGWVIFVLKLLTYGSHQGIAMLILIRVNQNQEALRRCQDGKRKFSPDRKLSDLNYKSDIRKGHIECIDLILALPIEELMLKCISIVGHVSSDPLG